MRSIDIFSNDLSNYNDQLKYKKEFLNKFGAEIDADDPFYFDDTEIINGVTGETIRGAELEKDTWKQITNILLTYFHIEV